MRKMVLTEFFFDDMPFSSGCDDIDDLELELDSVLLDEPADFGRSLSII